MLKDELQTTQSATVEAVKATSTVDAAAKAFQDTFEKPTNPVYSERLKDAKMLFQMM